MGSGFGHRRRSCRPNGGPVQFTIWGFRLLTLPRRQAQAPNLRPTNANLMQVPVCIYIYTFVFSYDIRNVQKPNSRGLLDLKQRLNPGKPSILVEGSVYEIRSPNAIRNRIVKYKKNISKDESSGQTLALYLI